MDAKSLQIDPGRESGSWRATFYNFLHKIEKEAVRSEATETNQARPALDPPPTLHPLPLFFEPPLPYSLHFLLNVVPRMSLSPLPLSQETELDSRPKVSARFPSFPPLLPSLELTLSSFPPAYLHPFHLSSRADGGDFRLLRQADLRGSV